MAKKQSDKSVTAFRTIIGIVMFFCVAIFAVAKLSRGGQETVRIADERVVQLAECLTSKGVKMYGAYWCAHCQKQKKEFGSAFEKINYVECTVQGNPRAQAKECEDAGIQSYPTWKFADGSTELGDQSFEDLAKRSGCEWP